MSQSNPSKIKRLAISRRYGERVKIGEFWIQLEYKGPNQVKLLIDAPEHIKITREELMEESPTPKYDAKMLALEDRLKGNPFDSSAIAELEQMKRAKGVAY